MQSSILRLVEGKLFQNTIIGLILINAIILGMETSQAIMKSYGTLLKSLDFFILSIFVIEILLRIYAYRLRFFRQPWGLFDLFVIAIALIPATGAFSALRALRILRVLRLISAVPSMRKVVEGLFTALPGIASVATIMLLLFYIFAVIGTHLYGATFPDWFGSIGKTMFTLFQIMTLESWSMGIVRPVMQQHPNAWAFFVIYILVTTFTVLNLFIAIIVNAMHKAADEEAEESRAQLKEQFSFEIGQLEERLTKLLKGRTDQ